MTRLAAPPGRTGRLWARRRLATAREAADLLEAKIVALTAARGELREEAEAARRDWSEAAHRAREAGDAALAAGGRRGVSLGTPREPARVEVTWERRAGVRCPRVGAVVLPATGGDAIDASAAVAVARSAHRAAVAAALRRAVAAAALRRVEEETAATRRRLRALRRRWEPRLEEVVRARDLELDEQERDEAVARRRGRA